MRPENLNEKIDYIIKKIKDENEINYKFTFLYFQINKYLIQKLENDFIKFDEMIKKIKIIQINY